MSDPKLSLISEDKQNRRLLQSQDVNENRNNYLVHLPLRSKAHSLATKYSKTKTAEENDSYVKSSLRFCPCKFIHAKRRN